ncbi:MAG: hypothetical protein GX456_10735 [Verrucomicrobia bacterium]|nr:hypothetical protein [Verrucomicrobiota bacterium]
MKAHLIALTVSVTTAALLPVVSTGAVIYVEEPQPLNTWQHMTVPLSESGGGQWLLRGWD